MLVLSIDREPWRTIENEGQRRTWAANEAIPDGCRVVFYYGGNGLRRPAARVAARLGRLQMLGPGAAAARRVVARISTRTAASGATLAGDRLHTSVPEAYPYTLPKLLAALRWAVAETSFDFVYRTNTSSYVNISRLREEAAGMPASRCYAGFLGNPPASGPPFVKGAGILMSWDIVRAAASYQGPWAWARNDDAALGRFADGLGVTPVQMSRALVRGPEDVRRLPDDELEREVLFRCKGRASERQDALTMLEIQARLNRLHSTGVPAPPSGRAASS